MGGLWQAIVAVGSRSNTYILPLTGDLGARRRLEAVCRRLDDSRDLVLDLAAEGSLPPICIRVAEHRLTPRYEVQLELLRRASTAPRRHDPGWTPAELGGFTRRC